MAKRAWLGSFFLVASFGVGAVIAACAADTPPDVPGYGPPNGLNGEKPPPPGAIDAAPTTTTTSTVPVGEGGGPPVTLACGTPVDGGVCNVKWKTQIYAAMLPGGTLKCSAPGTCHGGTATPPISATDSHAAYLSLVNYTQADNIAGGAAGTEYIDPCSIDPTKSSFVCNTAATPCGLAMPQVNATIGSTAAGAADQANILAWVKCGSPEN